MPRLTRSPILASAPLFAYRPQSYHTPKQRFLPNVGAKKDTGYTFPAVGIF